MNQEELVQRLMATFLGELEDHVGALNRDLLALESDHRADRTELLKTLFRTVHSLKGAARSVNIASIEATCHCLESILGNARDGLLSLEPELLQLLFSAADALKDAGERLRAKQDPSAGSLSILLPRLESVSRGAHPGQSEIPAVLPDPASASGPPAAGSAARDGFVRVPAKKLDALLARSGELLVAKSRAGSRREDVALLQETLDKARSEWRKVEKPLRKLLGSHESATGVDSASRGGPGARFLPRRAMLAIDRTAESLRKLTRDVDTLSARMTVDQHVLEQVVVPLEDDVRRTRMLPFGHACEGFERVVRDLALASRKQVDLVIEGSEVELDRSVLDGLKDPLLHLVRNAVDHGLEPAEVRAARRKPPRGRVTVSASLRGGGVEVVVADDGGGLDLETIREQARKRNMAIPAEDRQLARLIFLPGFSTAQLITELSGRGVGLDVVRHRVESLHGTVDVSFTPGGGTRFVLALPLTLTTLRALLVGCGGQIFALPIATVRRLVRAESANLGSVEGREVLLDGSAPIAVVALAGVLGIPSATTVHSGGRVALAVVAVGENQVAFAVDELLAEQEIVVKSLGTRLRHVRDLAGATILPTGRIGLILNASDLVEHALEHAPGPAVAATLEQEAPARKVRLIIADDSVTTRSLEKSILEAAGYEVLAAVDGAEAWEMLQDKGAELVVADVEMPRMDGFELTEVIRASKRFRDLPVVLVTALESGMDRERGLEAGADAYLPKSTFDQTVLLDAIRQLL